MPGGHRGLSVFTRPFLCVPVSHLYQERHPSHWVSPTLVTSVNPNCLCEGPIGSHIEIVGTDLNDELGARSPLSPHIMCTKHTFPRLQRSQIQFLVSTGESLLTHTFSAPPLSEADPGQHGRRRSFPGTAASPSPSVAPLAPLRLRTRGRAPRLPLLRMRSPPAHAPLGRGDGSRCSVTCVFQKSPDAAAVSSILLSEPVQPAGPSPLSRDKLCLLRRRLCGQDGKRRGEAGWVSALSAPRERLVTPSRPGPWDAARGLLHGEPFSPSSPSSSAQPLSPRVSAVTSTPHTLAEDSDRVCPAGVGRAAPGRHLVCSGRRLPRCKMAAAERPSRLVWTWVLRR